MILKVFLRHLISLKSCKILFSFVCFIGYIYQTGAFIKEYLQYRTAAVGSFENQFFSEMPGFTLLFSSRIAFDDIIKNNSLIKNSQEFKNWTDEYFEQKRNKNYEKTNSLLSRIYKEFRNISFEIL